MTGLSSVELRRGSDLWPGGACSVPALWDRSHVTGSDTGALGDCHIWGTLHRRPLASSKSE